MIEINITSFEKNNEKYFLFKYNILNKDIKIKAYRINDADEIMADYKEISGLETTILTSKVDNPKSRECTIIEMISIKKILEKAKPHNKIIYDTTQSQNFLQ
ncbi:MAG: hypothetical protein QXK76_02960 [Candidatus Woesearchaeota archaeon]